MEIIHVNFQFIILLLLIIDIADDSLANEPNNQAAMNHVGNEEMNRGDASINDRELNAGNSERGNITAATQAAQLTGTILYALYHL